MDESIKTERRNRMEEAEAQRQKFERMREDLLKDMEEKKLIGQRRMDKIEEQTREMERKHEEDKMGMIEDHKSEMERRERDQNEKKQAD